MSSEIRPEIKKRRDFLDPSRINSTHLPSKFNADMKRPTLGDVYQTYVKLLPKIRGLNQLQLKKNYSKPEMSLSALLQLKWREIALQSFKSSAEDEEIVDSSLDVKGLRGLALSAALFQYLSEIIAIELYRRGCLSKELCPLIAYNIAHQSLYHRKNRAYDQIVFDVMERFLPKDFPNLDIVLAKMGDFGDQVLPKIVQKMWILAGRSLGKIKKGTLKTLAADEKKEKAKKIIWKESAKLRKFYSTLLFVRALAIRDAVY